MSEWTTPQPPRRGGRGRGGRGRGRGRGGLRGPPEVVFASYELSDVQKKRIDVYIMQSAAMFLAQQVAEPCAVPAEEAKAAILNHWWQSLCMSRAAAGLATDVNSSALMYRSYQHGYAAADELEGLKLACAASDPAVELSEGWQGVLAEHFPDIPEDAFESLRGAAQEDKERQEKETALPSEKAPSLAGACVAGLATAKEPQFENCWADAMEEDE